MTSQANFYSRYDWCLNPALTLAEQLEQFSGEICRARVVAAEWQKQECRLNAWLLACAIGCTVEDYLAGFRLLRTRRQARLGARAAPRAPLMKGRPPFFFIQWIGDLLHWLRNLIVDRSVHTWSCQWRLVINQTTEYLLGGPEPDLESVRRVRLPLELLRRRMRIPEPFRCQDMTHGDVTDMARQYLLWTKSDAAPLVVIGARTAGAYFAPLVRAWVAAMGRHRVAWMTIRPKERLSWWERRRLRDLRRENARVLLVDDHPNTGETFDSMLRIMARHRVPLDRVTVLAPLHPSRPRWRIARDLPGAEHVRVLAISPDSRRKARLLDPSAVEPVLREHFRELGWDDASVELDPAVERISAQLESRCGDGFQVRMKRVFDVRLRRGYLVETRRIVAKSVGWGWFGYHAWHAAKRLDDFVPEVYCLRNGLLFTEWIDGAPLAAQSAADPLLIQRVATYVAARSRQLRLMQDPCFGTPGWRWIGWNELLHLERRRWPWPLGRILSPLLRRRLKKFVSPVPSLIDGQMRPSEWIATSAGVYKLDFEQHNFGGGELDIVDPVFDLAAAVREFGWGSGASQLLLETYMRESGDVTAGSRYPRYHELYEELYRRRAAYREAKVATMPEAQPAAA